MTKIMRPMLIDPTTEMAFMPIPGGQFIMGSPETEKDRQRSEGPQHAVKIEEFYLAQSAVTQEQYLKVMGENPSDLRGEQCPVDGVSWDDAQAFIAKLNAINNTHYRLPSEAQWEYACRANTHTRFSFGDEITIAQVNFGAKISCRNTPSGMHPANGFGLYDMHGNVFEWCEDTWHDSYEGAPEDGTAWVDDSSDHKVYRGGAWNASSHFARSAYRYHRPRTTSYYNIGFRLAL
nr:formylglycine-generating enzyme family protein [uncultured Desulfobulbus sp.]